MLDQAREYLARVIPWPAPGESGFVNIHWTFPPTRPNAGGKAIWTGRAVTSVAEAAKALDWALKSPDTLDVYACMSSQAQAQPKASRKAGSNFTWNAPVRLAQNALALKSFFLDIDLKPTQVDEHGHPSPNQKGYTTIEELGLALAGFIKAMDFPKPTMLVHSGGGLHVYWIMDRALTPDEWLPYAHALAEATKQHGLRCDTQCTVDSARVLRIPDTFNRKQSTPRNVRFIGTPVDFDYSVERIVSRLEPYKTARSFPAAGGIDVNLFPRLEPYVGLSELQSNLDTVYPSPDLSLVAGACAFVSGAISTGGADLDNPLWNLTTLISTFTKGGRADAHLMGNKHASYSPQETDEFFDRKDRERLERGLGWPSCNSISAAGAKACRSCAFFAQGKSPLNFEQRNAGVAAGQVHGAAAPTGGGAQTTAGTTPAFTSIAFGTVGQQSAVPSQFTNPQVPVGPSNQDIPVGYTRTPAGIVCKVVADPANPGNNIQIPVTDYPMLNAWIEGKGKDHDKILHFESVVERNTTTQIDLPLEVIATNEMRKCLQAQGLMITSTDKLSGDFYVAWVKQLQRLKDAVTSSPFGWLNTAGQIDGFVFGDKLWTTKGSEPAAVGSPKLAMRYRPKGSDQYWLDAAKLVTQQGRADLEAVVASAFAAPLVLFTGHKGMLMSAFSRESGIGKSTAVAIAQAVWGNPVKGVQGLNDTENAVMNIVGEIKSLPLYWDELKTDQDTKKFVKMTFQISAGKEKSRMNAKAELREPGEWQTLVISASNESLVDHVTSQTLTTEAGLMRIFEFNVAKSNSGKVDTSEATIRLSQLNNNYGHVGLKYAQFLGSNHAQIATDMKDLSKTIEHETKAQQEERFWVSLVACILLGARYAARIGYPVFDEKALKAFMYESLGHMRNHRSSQTVDLDKSINVSSIMNRFFNDMKRDNRWLVTNRIHVGQGKPPKPPHPGAVKVLFPMDTTRLNGIAVQVGQDNSLLRISSPAFGEWCKKAEINRQNILEALGKAVKMVPVNGKLGSGSGLAGASEHMYELDLTTSTDFDFTNEY